MCRTATRSGRVPLFTPGRSRRSRTSTAARWPPLYDGGPDAWWTPGGVNKSVNGFPGTTFIYPTRQQAGTIWFHDHALGATRLNVFAGMAGLYIITDPANEPPQAGANVCAAGGCLPKFPEYDIPLIIQDRSFDTAGQIFYNLASNPQPNPTVHPFWIPEFIGDAIVVNGKTWPYLTCRAPEVPLPPRERLQCPLLRPQAQQRRALHSSSRRTTGT